MNILDENIIDSQRLRLQSWRISVRQIGHELGRKGLKDSEIIPVLHQLSRPTFFTRDDDFYDRKLCHAGYCVVHLNVRKEEAATFVRQVLRYPAFNLISLAGIATFIWMELRYQELLKSFQNGGGTILNS